MKKKEWGLFSAFNVTGKEENVRGTHYIDSEKRDRLLAFPFLEGRGTNSGRGKMKPYNSSGRDVLHHFYQGREK